MTKKGKTIGILGGMGPEATVRLFDYIVKLTPAKQDQDHLKIYILNNPQIPDRTAAIFGIGESPLQALQEGINSLISNGVQIIAIPCVSAHYFFDKIVATNVILLNIIEKAIFHLVKFHPKVKTVGIIGTDLTVSTKLFDKYLNNYNISTLYPNRQVQQSHVMESIYEIKAGKYNTARDKLSIAMDQLIDEGAEAIIAGCTEIPLVFESDNTKVPFINVIESLALSIIEESFN